MDDITQKRLARAIKNLPSQKATEAKPYPARPSRINSKMIIVAVLVVMIAVLGSWRVFVFEQKPSAAIQNPSVLPASVRSQVNFPIPYPEQKKLPAGYTLNLSSFSATDQVVVYSIAYDQDKRIAITVQKKPSDDELKAFYANQIPIRNEVKVPAGMAAIGVINDQTFASLPTQEDAWLLITAPKDIDQNNLKRVLQAMRAD